MAVPLRPTKNPPERVFLCTTKLTESLQLGFLVLQRPCLGIEFLYFDLFRRGALVLGRGVEMTGTGTGFEFDLFHAFSRLLRFYRRGAHFCQHCVNAVLVDGAQRCIGRRCWPAVLAPTQKRRRCRLGKNDAWFCCSHEMLFPPSTFPSLDIHVPWFYSSQYSKERGFYRSKPECST